MNVNIYREITNEEAINEISKNKHKKILLCKVDMETEDTAYVDVNRYEATLVARNANTIVNYDDGYCLMLQCYSEKQDDIFNIKKHGSVSNLLMNSK